MSDPIRIPVHVSDGNFRWHCSGEIHDDIVRAIFARMVDLGLLPTPEPFRMPASYGGIALLSAPAPDAAGDEGAMDAMLKHLLQPATLRDCCRDILAAIKAGKVPGIYLEQDIIARVEQRMSEILNHQRIQIEALDRANASLKADNDRLRAELASIPSHASLMQPWPGPPRVGR